MRQYAAVNDQTLRAAAEDTASPEPPRWRRRVGILPDARSSFASKCGALSIADAISVSLLRLMAATNDARYAMKQLVRGLKGGRKPRNRVERAILAGEQSYLVRVVCGHLEEVGRVFRDVWGTAGAGR